MSVMSSTDAGASGRSRLDSSSSFNAYVTGHTTSSQGIVPGPEVISTGGGGLPFFVPTTTANYVDIFAAPNTAYLYIVRAVDAVTGTPTAYGTPDLATTVLFTDDPVVASSTFVKATHITELQTAVK